MKHIAAILFLLPPLSPITLPILVRVRVHYSEPPVGPRACVEVPEVGPPHGLSVRVLAQSLRVPYEHVPVGEPSPPIS